MSDYTDLRWEVDGHVATVWLSRPPVNAVTQSTLDEIRRLFGDPSQLGDGVRAIVLAGDAKHFCAGNDVKEFAGDLGPESFRLMMFNAREAFWALRDCPVPVVAAVHGGALGTGLCLAACCDLVIAADDARFGLPEIKVGTLGGAKFLDRLVPPTFVRWMTLTGQTLPAAELARFGGVLRTVPAEALLEEARAVAADIAAQSPVALSYAKGGLNDIEYLDLKRGYELEQRLTVRLSGHPHAAEAMAAFMEKRTPHYDD